MYVLITYYNRGTKRRPFWEVYGHIHEGNNDNLGTWPTEAKAQEHAFRYGLPVMRGSHGGGIDVALKKLST